MQAPDALGSASIPEIGRIMEALPPLIGSPSEARRQAEPLGSAVSALMRMGMEGLTPLSKIQLKAPTLSPSERQARDEALGDARCLAGEALAWILVEFFEQHPQALGFRYDIKRHRSAQDWARFSIAIQAVFDGQLWSAPGTPDKFWRSRLKEAMEPLPFALLVCAQGVAVQRPATPCQASAVETLLRDMASAGAWVEKDDFARWEAKALAPPLQPGAARVRCSL